MRLTILVIFNFLSLIIINSVFASSWIILDHSLGSVHIDKDSLSNQDGYIKANSGVIYIKPWKIKNEIPIVGIMATTLFDCTNKTTKSLFSTIFLADGNINHQVNAGNEFNAVKKGGLTELQLNYVCGKIATNYVNYIKECHVKIIGVAGKNTSQNSAGVFENVPYYIVSVSKKSNELQHCGLGTIDKFDFGNIEEYCRSKTQCDKVEDNLTKLINNTSFMEAKHYIYKLKNAWKLCDIKYNNKCTYLSKTYLKDYELK